MLQLFIIIGAVLLRLVPHMPNFAPISALALFGGVYLGKKYAIIIPLLTMMISDYLLLYISPSGIRFNQVQPISGMLHNTTPFVWGSFALSGIIGIWLRSHKKPLLILGGTLIASLQFYLITNFGVWAMGMYSRSLEGLLESYIMGIPFYRWTVLGDLFYTSFFFGSYEIARQLKLQIIAENKE